MMGQARTYMNTAIAEGLRRAGAKYTLPPIQGTLGTFADMELHARKHFLRTSRSDEQPGQGDAAGAGTNDQADETSTAAAAGMLLS